MALPWTLNCYTRIKLRQKRSHDTQHGNIQHNDTQHGNIQHNETQHNSKNTPLSIVTPDTECCNAVCRVGSSVMPSVAKLGAV
jgi:hypothetical protein